jgi:hypothetical protein
MKSAPFVSPNFMERVAEPDSRFHRDYLAYRSGEITRAELISRLPHVAMLGDSVCRAFTSHRRGARCGARTRLAGRIGFFTSTLLQAFAVFRKAGDNHAFCRDRMRGGWCLVDHEHCRQDLFRRILGTRNFSGQVGELVRAHRFPI